MFIASEVMFFVAWFWAYFDASLFPGEAIQASPAPSSPAASGRRRASRFSIPGTCRSQHRSSCCLGHDGDLGAPRAAARRPQGPDQGPDAHGLLGILFSACRPTSTSTRPFAFKDSIYGATFFMATGFHGFHVIIGTIFLLVCLSVPARRLHAEAAFRLRVRRLVLALRRRGLAVPVRLDLCLGPNPIRSGISRPP
jgi:cytochrome c oxidase subunit 3